MPPIRRLKVGDIVKVGVSAYVYFGERNDSYSGMWGYVFKCGTKCRCGLRIQFLDMGNNEKAKRFDLSKCKVIRPVRERF